MFPQVLLKTLLGTLTEADQVPYVGLWGGAENHVHQPEGVENLYAHPGEGAEQAVVEGGPHPGAQTLPSHVGQHPGEEEEQVEDGEGHG